MNQLLCSCGEPIIVSQTNYPLVSGFNWSCNRKGGPVSCFRNTEEGRITIKLCHLVLGVVGTKKMFDHKDRNAHNNLEDNLREATYSQNNANRGLGKNNTSGYKGVNYHKGAWRAAIKRNGVRLELGRFQDINEAAKVYNEAAIKVFGEFAVLNVITT